MRQVCFKGRARQDDTSRVSGVYADRAGARGCSLPTSREGSEKTHMANLAAALKTTQGITDKKSKNETQDFVQNVQLIQRNSELTGLNLVRAGIGVDANGRKTPAERQGLQTGHRRKARPHVALGNTMQT